MTAKQIASFWGHVQMEKIMNDFENENVLLDSNAANNNVNNNNNSNSTNNANLNQQQSSRTPITPSPLYNTPSKTVNFFGASDLDR